MYKIFIPIIAFFSLFGLFFLFISNHRTVETSPPETVAVQLPVDHVNMEVVPEMGEQFVAKGPRIVDIPENTWVWCRPWTMWVTYKGQYFINGYHDYSTEPQKNWMRIMRKGDTFSVSLSGTDYVWSAMKIDISPDDHRTVTMSVTDIKP